jgi:hypothetical protein
MLANVFMFDTYTEISLPLSRASELDLFKSSFHPSKSINAVCFSFVFFCKEGLVYSIIMSLNLNPHSLRFEQHDTFS